MLFGKNILDLIIIAILLFCAIRSFFKGTIREIFSLLALVGGIFLARRFYPQIAQSLGRGGRSGVATNIVAFILLFFAVYILVIILGMLLRSLIKTVKLGWLDRLGGAILGLIKGGFLICLLIIMLVLIFPSDSQLIQASRLAPLFYQTSSLLMRFAPAAVRDGFGKKVEKLEKARERKLSPDRQTSGKKRLHIFSFSLSSPQQKASAVEVFETGIW